MGYAPVIKSARPRRQFSIGDHTAVLFGDIVPVGSIEYLYILAVFEREGSQPCCFVTSEINSMAGELGGGSHFLCVFENERHSNLGASDVWADEEKFTAEAVRIVQRMFGVEK